MPRMAADARTRRRRQFVEAANRLSAQKSYRDLTIDDVCVEAGLSKGSFYSHFDSKHELLLAMLEDDDALVAKVLDGLDQDHRPAPDAIKRVVRALLRAGMDPARRQLRADLWAAAAADDDLRARLGDSIARRRKRLAAWVAAAEERGDFAEVPANAFAAALLALADGLTLHAAADPGGFRWVNINRVVDMVVDGLVPDTSAQR